jgi:O-acetylhomoserine/O-acetylserine sulfhydrylase-like pyridoxal-dependent enzyme
MAISQAMCSSYKEQLLGAVHDMDTDVFKIALYTSSATLGAATTIYSTSDEVVATGYTAGGNTLSGAAITLSGTTAFVDFSNTTWTTATITARGALIYNSSKSNKSVAVLDFGGDKSSTAGDFTVIMPTPDATNALIRIA